MPSMLGTLQNLAQVLERLQVDYMLIGGYALPAYGLLRATVDIDIAIFMRLPEPMELKKELERADFQVSSFTQETPCFVVTDLKAVVEIEVWLKPDGIVMDDECLRRRRKIKIGGLDFWIIGPEDFIVNKLSRRDRRVQDETDVVSVLRNARLKLDVPYLYEIAERADILPPLKVVEKKAREERAIG